jgi:hypothetical protein
MASGRGDPCVGAVSDVGAFRLLWQPESGAGTAGNSGSVSECSRVTLGVVPIRLTLEFLLCSQNGSRQCLQLVAILASPLSDLTGSVWRSIASARDFRAQ